jgi:hypothetical protein
MSSQTIPEYAQQLLDKQSDIEAKLSSLEPIIGKARKNAMGITLDADKTPEWREAKRLYAIYWDQYRAVNQQLNKIRKAKGFEAVNGKRVTVYQYN